MEQTERRQQLLDQLSEVVVELFADGIEETNDVIKRMILHGLDKKRLSICAEVLLPPVRPMRVAFGVLSHDATDCTLLFEIDSVKHKPVTITPLSPSTDAVQ